MHYNHLLKKILTIAAFDDIMQQWIANSAKVRKYPSIEFEKASSQTIIKWGVIYENVVQIFIISIVIRNCHIGVQFAAAGDHSWIWRFKRWFDRFQRKKLSGCSGGKRLSRQYLLLSSGFIVLRSSYWSHQKNWAAIQYETEFFQYLNDREKDYPLEHTRRKKDLTPCWP